MRGKEIITLYQNKRWMIMILEIQKYLWTKNYYKIAIIIISLNAIFELVFKYRFQTRIEIIYFFISGFISAVMIKSIVKTESYIPVFYYFWPFIMLIINYISLCQFASLPFVVTSFIIVIFGKFRYKLLKILILVTNLTAMVIYLVLVVGYYIASPQKDILETVYSHDKKYIMVVEETEFFMGGQVYVYLGRNVDFGILGHYKPVKVKYYGHTGETPEIQFIDDDFISINGQLIEIKGSNYIDDY